jgi:C4-dicarboxylate transporter, DctM subunit
MAALIYFVLPLVLLALGLPIYLILLVTSFVGIAYSGGLPLSILQTVTFGSLGSISLLAVLLFVLTGDIMARGGLAKRLIDWVLGVVGGVRGSLALTTVVSSELFGAMSGSSMGCVAAVGRLMYPSLQTNYGNRFAASLITASGAVAVVVPPSIPMIVYGVAAQQSVPKLFVAGILPAILIGIFVSIYVVAYARVKNIKITKRAPSSDLFAATREAGWALGVPMLVLGGIYGGVFTPTEAAGIAVIYASLVCRYVYKDITWPQLWRLASGSMYLIAQILMIVAAAGLYSWLVTTSGFPQQLMKAVSAMALSRWQLLLGFNLILLVVGSFLEPTPAILILTPFLLPTVKAVGIDEIHFGIIMTVNLAIGMFLPPFGLNILTSHAMFHFPLGTLYRGVLPFIAVYFAALMLITYVPDISLLLLRMMK